eukprot:CAMPEP_0184312434 /NCGR_PEP_ID=MMETSP1049-20130417/50224_1 /TAXON_ID=77928 /ORGANISM="Proteomonas sulcata, Strain CCMP704" /LENGTH=31 /DNA_ID= /DNA_START= /DNA_END= /DNA_ORIENTATION=
MQREDSDLNFEVIRVGESQEFAFFGLAFLKQ